MTLTDAQQTALAGMLRRAAAGYADDAKSAAANYTRYNRARHWQTVRDSHNTSNRAALALAAAIERAAAVTLADDAPTPTEPRCTICDRPNLRPCQPCADMIAAGWTHVAGQWRHHTRQLAE